MVPLMEVQAGGFLPGRDLERKMRRGCFVMEREMTSFWGEVEGEKGKGKGPDLALREPCRHASQICQPSKLPCQSGGRGRRASRSAAVRRSAAFISLLEGGADEVCGGGLGGEVGYLLAGQVDDRSVGEQPSISFSRRKGAAQIWTGHRAHT